MTVGDRGALRVLVVDDEEDVRLVLGFQLAAEPDIEVVGHAVDGEEALAQCERLQPDAVVMDLLMPNVSGFEAIARMQEEFPDIGIVAYTGVAGEFVRHEMARVDVSLVLKAGEVTALADALRRSVVRR